MVPEKIARTSDPDALRNLMENMRHFDRDDVHWLAFRQRFSLEGMKVDDPSECNLYEVLNAYGNNRMIECARGLRNDHCSSHETCFVFFVAWVVKS